VSGELPSSSHYAFKAWGFRGFLKLSQWCWHVESVRALLITTHIKG
jgi:hypothetical protein